MAAYRDVLAVQQRQNDAGRRMATDESMKTVVCSNSMHKICPDSSSKCVISSKQERNVRRHPVQRAPSRLYRPGAPPDKYRCPNTCIGPEFVVRAAQPTKVVHIGDIKPAHRRKVVVILLNGQKLEIACDPNVATARQIFEVVVQSEGLAENFTLGLAALLGGDFVFLRSDTRLSKVAPSTWSSLLSFTLYLRVKFFLPSLRGIRWGTKHLLYLQLRKSLLECQLVCGVEQHFSLSGLALQAEFGDYSDQEHGCGDYFLLEHYVPDAVLQDKEEAVIRTELQKQHRQRQGLDPGRAEEMYIAHVQALPHYGCHFHSAICVSKTGTSQAVWVTVRLQGIFLYQYTADKPLLHGFQWSQLQNLSYSRHCFYLQPHGHTAKFKLCMDHNKSFFLFHLASLHHRFFLKLRSEMISLKPLSTEFGIPMKEENGDSNQSMYTERISSRRHITSIHSGLSQCSDNMTKGPNLCRSSKDSPHSVNVIDIEEYQNKENERPVSCHIPADKTASHPRRQRVRMGTKAFLCTAQQMTPDLLTRTQSVVVDDTGSLPSLSDFSLHSAPSDAYVVNSSIKSTDERFHINFQETLSESLLEKFNKISCEEEHVLQTVRLQRDTRGSLGVQISKGQDGGVYIHAVIPEGPAAAQGIIYKGDQVVAVNGHNLLNVKYEDAVLVLQSSGEEVELVLSQVCTSGVQRMQPQRDTEQKSMKKKSECQTTVVSDTNPMQTNPSSVPLQTVPRLVITGALCKEPIQDKSVVTTSQNRTSRSYVRRIKYPAPPVPSSRDSIRAVCCVAPTDEDSDDLLAKEQEAFL